MVVPVVLLEILLQIFAPVVLAVILMMLLPILWSVGTPAFLPYVGLG